MGMHKNIFCVVNWSQYTNVDEKIFDNVTKSISTMNVTYYKIISIDLTFSQVNWIKYIHIDSICQY